jgi:flagellar basal-body rod modification protein FlgD
MQTYAIGSTAVVPTGSDSTFGRLKTEDFFRLLVTELEHQDPLAPTKTADMINQVAQIRTIEQSAQLVSTLQELTRQQRAAGVSQLLGKMVEAVMTGPDGSTTTTRGIVTAVRFGPDGTALLELDTGQVVRAIDVIRIADADEDLISAANTSGTGSADAAQPPGTPADKTATASQSKPVGRRRGLFLNGFSLNF